jgi:hypothetical protein
MKKALTLVLLIVSPTLAFAQGTVVFSNSTSGLVKQWTSFTDHTLINVPVGGGSVQLLAAPAGMMLKPLVWGSVQVSVLTIDTFGACW